MYYKVCKLWRKKIIDFSKNRAENDLFSSKKTNDELVRQDQRLRPFLKPTKPWELIKLCLSGCIVYTSWSTRGCPWNKKIFLKKFPSWNKIGFFLLAYVINGIFMGSLKKCQQIRSRRLAGYSWHCGRRRSTTLASDNFQTKHQF